MEHKKKIGKKGRTTIEDIVGLPRRMTEIFEGLEDELEYLIDHNFFDEFQQLSNNMNQMMRQMEELNDSINNFTASVDKITANTEVINKLEKRMSLRGLIVHTIKDFFFMLRQLIEVTIFRNYRKIKNLRSGRDENDETGEA